MKHDDRIGRRLFFAQLFYHLWGASPFTFHGCEDGSQKAKASFASKVQGPDAEKWLTTGEALRAATEGSARALGMDREIGKIARGFKADIVFLDSPQGPEEIARGVKAAGSVPSFNVVQALNPAKCPTAAEAGAMGIKIGTYPTAMLSPAAAGMKAGLAALVAGEAEATRQNSSPPSPDSATLIPSFAAARAISQVLRPSVLG